MLDHLSLQVADVDAAAAFYTRVFAPAGIRDAVDAVFAAALEAVHHTFPA
jgi:catechol 2,3-dioxygenase-like lactoylglutathione lyase family enzyme